MSTRNYNTTHNLPILREGTIASDPTVDFNGQEILVADMICMPGSSGSPVVSEDGQTLLGILFSGPLSPIMIQPDPATLQHLAVTHGRDYTRIFEDFRALNPFLFPIALGHIIKKYRLDEILRSI